MGRLGMRAPVRPVTPPQLQLHLNFGTPKQREAYARQVLKQVVHIEAARAQQGFGSAYVAEEDKEGAINDDFAEEREEARWRLEQARRSTQMESSRSNPELQRTELRPVTFHPQPRRPPQSARPAGASSTSGNFGADLHSPPRPQTSMGPSESATTFLTCTDFEETRRLPWDSAGVSGSPKAVVLGSHFPPPRREERMASVEVQPHAPGRSSTRTTAEEEEGMQMWEQAERAPFHTTMDPADVEGDMAETRDRWGHHPAASQPVRERMQDWVGLDKECRQRVAAEAREVELNRLTVAHYSQKGLPYLMRASADLTRERLNKLRDATADKKSTVGSLVSMSMHSRTPSEGLLRETITEAIIEDNKVLQKTHGNGRVSTAPASAAADRVSEPGPSQWPEPTVPWQRDPVTGDWHRADKVTRILGLLLRIRAFLQNLKAFCCGDRTLLRRCRSLATGTIPTKYRDVGLFCDMLGLSFGFFRGYVGLVYRLVDTCRYVC